jgi:rSAM/selenodomain-associated transferase 1
VTAEVRHRVLDPFSFEEVPSGLCALGIMTKAPRAGAVKTRLQPPLTPEEAAALNICFLRDTATAISHAGKPGHGVGVFTPRGSENEYQQIFPAEFDLLLQRGNDFGERLLHAVEDLLTLGFESCCLINSDSPTVTADVFRTAVELLRADHNRLVLGPSDDGGYYLIGMSKLHRRIFEEIDWSTESVLPQTLERARELGLDIETLPTFCDVDDAVSLRRLCHEMLGAQHAKAPATRAFLEQLIARKSPQRIWPQ